MSDLESRLAALERYHLLDQLVRTYAFVIDSRDFESLRDLFCPDALVRTLRPGGRVTEGAAEIAAGMAERFLGYDRTFHVVHGILLGECTATTASAVTSGHAEVVRDGIPMIAAMRYHDEFRHLDGRWRFASRTQAFFYYLRADDYAAALASGTPVRTGAEWLPSDW